jgi:hypothetical protein
VTSLPDTTGPDTTIISGPPDVTTERTAAFTFSSPATDLRAFDRKLDDGAFSSCVSPKTYNSSALPVGTHTFSVRGRDMLGNHGDPVGCTWTIQAPALAPPPPPTLPPASPPPPPAPPPASLPPAPPRQPTVKKKVVKIAVCHKGKTKKVTKAQLKKLKGAKRGACKPKKKTKKR